MRFLALGSAFLAALTLAACASAPSSRYLAPRYPTPGGPLPPVTVPAPPAPPRPTAANSQRLDRLPGWADEDHRAALDAFRAGCDVAKDAPSTLMCRRARALGGVDEIEARRFLEANFRAEPVGAAGLLTAYFAPMYEARRRADTEFSAPLRPKPDDLVTVNLGDFGRGLPSNAVGRERDGKIEPYPDRAAIDISKTDGALAWMRPEDLYFLQIQGSGLLTFEDGRRLRAAFAGHNGQPYVGVAAPMREKGLLADQNTSGDAIRRWLADHRGPEAEAIMALNPRYVFFNLGPDDGREAVGAAGRALPAGRAIAVDLSQNALGGFYWIDAAAPRLAGAFPVYRRAVMALDTGGAIKGAARADLYMGTGPDAGTEAGRVRHTLALYRLVPVS